LGHDDVEYLRELLRTLLPDVPCVVCQKH
jgi:hypothetical protein